MFIGEFWGILFSDKSKCLEPEIRPIFAQLGVVHFLLPTIYAQVVANCCVQSLTMCNMENLLRRAIPVLFIVHSS
jgi:hypothetical protein